MRKTVDLIKELKSEAKDFTYTWLAVSFEKTCEFVEAGDKDPQKKLDDLVSKGGEPVGLIFMNYREGEGSLKRFHDTVKKRGKVIGIRGMKIRATDEADAFCCARLLKEHADVSWARKYLVRVMANFHTELPLLSLEPTPAQPGEQRN